MGIKLFNSTINLMQQRYSETVEQAKFVVKDANLHVNKCCYVYKALQFHKLRKCNKGKVKHYK